MAGRWKYRISFLILSILAPSLVSADHSFENTAIVRTVELGGSLVHVTTTYAVKALEDDSSIYTIALGEDEQKKTSWIQAKMKGHTVPLHLEKFGLNPKTYVTYCFIANLSLMGHVVHMQFQWRILICRRVPEDLESERDRQSGC